MDNKLSIEYYWSIRIQFIDKPEYKLK